MCCREMAKCFLIIINIGFFLLGAALLIIGILVKLDPDALLGGLDSIPVVSAVSDLISGASDAVGEYNSDLTALLESSGWILIGIGSVVFIIGFLGLCGACYGNKVYLWTYAFIVLLILLVEVGLVIFVLIEGDNVEDDIIKVLNDTIKSYSGMEITQDEDSFDIKAPSDPVSFAWDVFHVSMKCCGVTNYTDFAGHDWSKGYNFTVDTLNTTGKVLVPATCCDTITLSYFPDKLNEFSSDDQKAIVTCMIDPSQGVHKKGCYTTLMDYLKEYMYVVIGVACGIVVIQILAIIAGCVLSREGK